MMRLKSFIRKPDKTTTQNGGGFYFAVMLSAMTALAGCSNTGMKWSDAHSPPPGYTFSNGMAPSSEGPPPSWYAQRFNRPRGLGEAITQDRHAVWERDKGTFALYVGGMFFAQFQPWEHYLQIRTDGKDSDNIICHWDPKGVLTMSEEAGGTVPAGSETTCKHLLDELENYVAPGGLVAHKKGS